MTSLHRLTAADVEYTDHKDTLDRRFNEDTEGHVLTVLHDDGLYRHLRFKNPERSSYWFELITWPGNLTIAGDMGTYTFRRITDMFEFFRGYINVDYWAEKLQAGDTGGRRTVQEYDEELFKKWVLQDFWKASRDLDHDVTTSWWEAIKEEVLDDWTDTGSTDSAFNALAALDRTQCAPLNHYEDAWGSAGGWEQYTIHFEWCLAAIVTGIRTYEAHKAAADSDLLGTLMAALTEHKDMIMPTRAQVAALLEEAKARGCGLLVEQGRPGTLRVCPGAVVGQLLVIDPQAIA